MNSIVQTVAALLVVALVATLLLRSYLKKRRQPGCAGGCGCSSDQFKKQIKLAE